MHKYIDADLLISKELIPLTKRLGCCHPKQMKGVLMAMSKIDSAPTADVVEVVRCKDCKHARKTETILGVADYRCLITNITCLDADDFCSYGERKR